MVEKRFGKVLVAELFRETPIPGIRTNRSASALGNAGAGLGVLWLMGIVVVGFEPMLENLHYLGYAAFFFFTGRGRRSLRPGFRALE
jgi:hypothetical protein